MANDQRIPKIQYWIEFISVVFLSIATVASAWCGYEATRWSGVQNRAFGKASALRTESVRQTNIATRKIAIDVAMFLQYAEALSEGNERFSKFLLERFRPVMQKTVTLWLASKPFTNPDAPKSPFDMKEYSIAELQEAQGLVNDADAKVEEAKNANQLCDDYVLLTVYFASVLFFMGIAAKFQVPLAQISMLCFGVIIFIIAVINLVSYPIM